MSTAPAITFRVTAFLGFLAVALGASGAHGPLYELLVRRAAVEIWEKAVAYQFFHAIAMLVLVILRPFPRVAWSLFLLGVVMFSGSLYLLALTGVHWVGYFTPIGGLNLLGAWLSLALWPGANTALAK